MGKWTAGDIPDQAGRVAVVTGANSGIGMIAARELARANATVVLACRNAGKAEEAARSIRRDVTGARLEVADLDLASLASIERFARNFATANERLDLLINNAGVMAPPRRMTEDRFELQIGTNHLGHFALTGRLLQTLMDTAGARVVTVSSGAHRTGSMNFDDLQSERRYRKWSAYGQSKLANLLFAFEFQRRLTAAGSDVLSVAAHPGYSATNLQSAGPMLGGISLDGLLMRVSNVLIAQSDERGALPTLYAATEPDVPPGAYVGPDGIAEARGHPKLVGCSGAARDEDVAGRLWELSEKLTGVEYAFGADASPA